MDNLAAGGTKEEVHRFEGARDENLQYLGTMKQILAKGGLNMVVSGELEGLALEKLGASVLGLHFSTHKNLLFARFADQKAKKDKKVKVSRERDQEGQTTRPLRGNATIGIVEILNQRCSDGRKEKAPDVR